MPGRSNDQSCFAAETRFANILCRLNRAKIDGYVSRGDRLIERTSLIASRDNRQIGVVLNRSGNRLDRKSTRLNSSH